MQPSVLIDRGHIRPLQSEGISISQHSATWIRSFIDNQDSAATLTAVLTDVVKVGKLRPSDVGHDNVEPAETLDSLSRDLVDALMAERVSGNDNVARSSERVARLLGTVLVRAVVDRDLGSAVGQDLADGSA